MKRLVLVVLILGVMLTAACGAEPTPTDLPPKVKPPELTDDTTFESPLDMANPASVYCKEQGYELEIREAEGGQVGYCVFPDGTECEEWAFYRGECGPGTPKP
jgi:putative hemolysin